MKQRSNGLKTCSRGLILNAQTAYLNLTKHISKEADCWVARTAARLTALGSIAFRFIPIPSLVSTGRDQLAWLRQFYLFPISV